VADTDDDRMEGEEKLSRREWRIFLAFGVPVIGLLAVLRTLFVEESSLSTAIGAALLVVAYLVIASLFFMYRARR
jgi:hypothetical protein